MPASSPYTCRRATIDDAAAISALRNTQLSSPLTCAPQPETPELTALQIKDPRCLAVVVLEGKALVAYVFFHLMVAPANEAVARIWMLDFSRPQTQLETIGKTLLVEACKQLQAAGITRVVSRSLAQQAAATAFISSFIPATSQEEGRLRNWDFDVAKVLAACQK